MAGHICVECSNNPKYGGCCVLTNDDTRMPITEEDVLRIERVTGLDRSDIVHSEEVPSDYLEVMAEVLDSSVFSWMAKNGPIHSMKINPQTRECVFLKEGVGCTLKEHRPAICRTFPFNPVFLPETGELSLPLSFGDGCLACHRAERDANVVIELLEQTEEGILEAVHELLAATVNKE